MKYWKLFRRYLVIRYRRMIEYRASFLLGLLGGISTLIAFFIFWAVIFSRVDSINGWTFPQILMLLGFFYFAMGIYWVFLIGAEHFHDSIIYGDLDTVLSKPVNPVINQLFSKIDFFGLIDFTRGVFLLFLSYFLGLKIPLINFISAVVIAILGAIAIGLAVLFTNLLTFWVGRSEALIRSIWELIWEPSGYPLTIFPVFAQAFYTFLIPLIFVQTYPVIITTQQVSIALVAKILLMELLVIGAWTGVCYVTWKKGLERYESLGG